MPSFESMGASVVSAFDLSAVVEFVDQSAVMIHCHGVQQPLPKRFVKFREHRISHLKSLKEVLEGFRFGKPRQPLLFQTVVLFLRAIEAGNVTVIAFSVLILILSGSGIFRNALLNQLGQFFHFLREFYALASHV